MVGEDRPYDRMLSLELPILRTIPLFLHRFGTEGSEAWPPERCEGGFDSSRLDQH